MHQEPAQKALNPHSLSWHCTGGSTVPLLAPIAIITVSLFIIVTIYQRSHVAGTVGALQPFSIKAFKNFMRDAIVVPILQMRKSRLREAQLLAQSHKGYHCAVNSLVLITPTSQWTPEGILYIFTLGGRSWAAPCARTGNKVFCHNCLSTSGSLWETEASWPHKLRGKKTPQLLGPQFQPPMQLPASRGQLREAVQGQPPPPLELIKLRQARRKCISAWWKQTDLLLGGASRRIREEGHLSPSKKPAGWCRSGCQSETLAWGNQTQGSPTTLLLGLEPMGKGQSVCSRKPIQTYQDMHRTPTKYVFTKQGGTHKHFGWPTGAAWLPVLKPGHLRQTMLLGSVRTHKHVDEAQVHTRTCAHTHKINANIHWCRCSEFQYPICHKSVQPGASYQTIPYHSFLICETVCSLLS